MTSQRDETVSHDETVGHPADDEMTDDPIVIERHDEILGGPPAEDPGADDTFARDAVTDDNPPAGDEPATASQPATTWPPAAGRRRTG